MKPSELNHRQNDYSSNYRTSRKPSDSLNDEIENKIVRLYTSGTSIESITKEVGRARYRVVHVLQSKGVFGNGPAVPKESNREPLIIEKPKEEPSDLGSEPVAAGQKPSKQPRKTTSPRKPAAKRKPALSVAKKPNRWSPPVLDALCEVAMQANLYPGKSIEQVRRIISASNP